MSGLLRDFERVARRSPCVVCGRGDWCLRARDGSGRAVCSRAPSPRRWGEAGWLHGAPFRLRAQEKYHLAESPDESRFRRIAARCRQRAVENARRLADLATELGVDVAALDALAVGLDELGGSTWPMRDHLGRMIGIRRRSHGEKRAIRGSRNGLFVPDVAETTRVVVTEGESDCAAALSLGFFAIGRPGCQGGGELLSRWIGCRADRDLAIVADVDEVGRRGAASLASLLAPYCRSVRIAAPPRGAKDLRAALLAGAGTAELADAIERGDLVRPVLRVVERRVR